MRERLICDSDEISTCPSSVWLNSRSHRSPGPILVDSTVEMRRLPTSSSRLCALGSCRYMRMATRLASGISFADRARIACTAEHAQNVCQLLSLCSLWHMSSLRQLQHYEIWKYYQSTSKVHAKVLQNLIVCRYMCMATRWASGISFADSALVACTAGCRHCGSAAQSVFNSYKPCLRQL